MNGFDYLFNPALWGFLAFPLLMVVVLVVVLLSGPAKRVAESGGATGSAIRAARAAGPKEGWSGYVIGAVMLVLIFGLGGYVLSTLGASQDKVDARTPASSNASAAEAYIGDDGRVWGVTYLSDDGEWVDPDMMRTQNDEGLAGYISVEEMYAAQDAAFAELDGPGAAEREIPLYDESGEVVGSYTVKVRAV